MEAQIVNEMEEQASNTDDVTRCVTSFTFTLQHFSQFDEDVRSPPCMIRGIPWVILIKKNKHTGLTGLGLYLECNKDSTITSWSCHANVTLAIVSQIEDIEHSSSKMNETFSKERATLGWSHFMDWDVVINPDNGCIKDDTVIFRAEVIADSPVGIPSDCQICAGHVSLKNQETVWDWNLQFENLFTKGEMDFKPWAPLSNVNQSVLDRVRLAYIYGLHGREALIITEDDEVKVYAMDSFSCASFRKADAQNATHGNEYMVDALNKQGIKGLSFGLNQGKLEVAKDDDTTTFLVICTSSGNVIQFGQPYFDEEINESESDVIPISELGCLPKISEVACGSEFSLALSTTGQVFSWGSNECGQIGSGDSSEDYYDIPYEIENALKNKRVIKISCGFSFAVVVLDDGQIYTWGKDVCEHNRCEYLPVPVPLNGVVVKEIACGFSNVLAVSHACELYVWGMNNRGQLGLGDFGSRSAPTKNKAIEKVVDIAASYLSCTSAAITGDSEVFMWGDCSGAVVLEPVKTPHKSLMEVFAYYGTPKTSYKPIIRQSKFKSVNDTMRRAFNDKTTSDLIIEVDGREIFVHRAILRMRSEYLQVFLKDQWTHENQKTLKINQPYNVIFSYLQYLYTGDFEANTDWTPELLILADEYQDLSFKELCEEKVHYQITEDNVGILFPLALKLNYKRLQESCVSLASSCMSKVLKTSAFRNWDTDTLIEFIVRCDKKRLSKN